MAPLFLKTRFTIAHLHNLGLVAVVVAGGNRGPALRAKGLGVRAVLVEEGGAASADHLDVALVGAGELAGGDVPGGVRGKGGVASLGVELVGDIGLEGAAAVGGDSNTWKNRDGG